MLYQVSLSVSWVNQVYHLEVEAESEEQAELKARDLLDDHTQVYVELIEEYGDCEE